MKISKEENGDIKIEMETDLDVAFWTNIKKERQMYEAENKSLHKQVKILADDNSYLKYMLDNNNVIYDKAE